MSDLVFRAMTFARHVHREQKRKYTGNPYVDHLAEVAGITAAVTNWPEAIAIAWLHDCVEDQGIAESVLIDRFGLMVAHGVAYLSDMETGNRAQRKQLSRDRLAAAPGWIQTIKCADLISNTSSIVEHDPAFAKVYLEEKRLLLAAMTKADPRLRDIAKAQAGI